MNIDDIVKTGFSSAQIRALLNVRITSNYIASEQNKFMVIPLRLVICDIFVCSRFILLFCFGNSYQLCFKSVLNWLKITFISLN